MKSFTSREVKHFPMLWIQIQSLEI